MLKDGSIPKPRTINRGASQTAVWKISSALVRLAAPILVFTAEEIWKFLPKAAEEPESVHMTLFSEEADLRTNITPKQVANWEQLAKIRGEVLKALEAPPATKRKLTPDSKRKCCSTLRSSSKPS